MTTQSAGVPEQRNVGTLRSRTAATRTGDLIEIECPTPLMSCSGETTVTSPIACRASATAVIPKLL